MGEKVVLTAFGGVLMLVVFVVLGVFMEPFGWFGLAVCRQEPFRLALGASGVHNVISLSTRPRGLIRGTRVVDDVYI